MASFPARRSSTPTGTSSCCAGSRATGIVRSTTPPLRTCASCIHAPPWNASGNATKASLTSLRRSASSTPTFFELDLRVKTKSIAEIARAVVRCTRCPELRAYAARVARERKRAHRDCEYWGKPVPSFGDPRARVMIVGLAPGAHGSNRTGRPFTGDASGAFLYPALYRAGFASQPEAIDRDDGLMLRDALITAAARCAPPQNKPTPAELRNCFPYLLEEFDALTRLRVIVALGSVAFTAALKVLRERYFAFEPATFSHGDRTAGAQRPAEHRGRRVISPQPAEHEHRQAYRADVRCDLQPGE